MAPLTELDRSKGYWGHQLHAELPLAQNETTTRLKASVTPKIGSKGWNVQAEQGRSACKTAMYGGSLKEMSFAEISNGRAARP